MVKRGGTKRKIPIQKILNKQQLAVSYTKRKAGLFNKASQLCLLTGSQIAILAAPPSSESNVSFNSFGHSSVDAVVSAFLSGQPLAPVPSELKKQMREDVGICMAQKSLLGLGFWWDDKKLDSSKDVNELLEALDSMSKLASKLEDDEELMTKKNNDKRVLHGESSSGTLNLGLYDYINNDDNQIDAIDQTLDLDASYLEGMDNQFVLHGESSSAIDQTLNLDDALCDYSNNDSPQDQQLIDFGNNLEECLLADDDDNNNHNLVPEDQASLEELIPLESLIDDGFFNNLEDLHEFTSSYLMDEEDSDPSIFLL